MGVVGLGEPFALVAAAPAVLEHAVDQPGPVPGLDGDQRGQRDALVAAAGDLHHRGGAAPAPVGFLNPATGVELGFHAARSYSLMRPPRTSRRLIRSWGSSAMGWSGRG